MKKLKLNNKLLTNAIISALIVQQTPSLVNSFIFKDNPLTGYMAVGSGAVAGVIASFLLKKPEIATLSVAFAGADILNEVIGTTLLANSNPVQDFISIDSAGKPVFALQDYTNNPEVMPTSEYSKAYNVLN